MFRLKSQEKGISEEVTIKQRYLNKVKSEPYEDQRERGGGGVLIWSSSCHPCTGPC